MTTNSSSSLTSATFRTMQVLKDGTPPKFEEMEVCEIRQAANKQTVGVFPAHEAAEWAPTPEGGRVRVTYAEKYNEQYLAFKNHQSQVQDGTPLEAATFLDATQRAQLRALHIHTLEALASIDGQPLKLLGMGGRDLKNKAEAFLADNSTPVTEEHLTSIISEQDRKIADLEARLAKFDHDGDGKAGGAKAAAEIPPADEKPKSPFEDYSDEDIINWLKDVSPELKIDGRWSRETLIAKADEANAELAKKNGKKVS
jgi:hypothetical protein